jgi:hypothetical protein
LGVAFLCQSVLVPAALAAPAHPPSPPPPPDCGWCGGPPLPPTPVPTVSEKHVAAASVVVVQLSPVRMKRGQTAKLTVKGSSGDPVTAVVHYRHGKPVTYHGKLSASGAYTKSWKVSKLAPLGKGNLKTTVKTTGSPFVNTVAFTVVR